MLLTIDVKVLISMRGSANVVTRIDKKKVAMRDRRSLLHIESVTDELPPKTNDPARIITAFGSQ